MGCTKIVNSAKLELLQIKLKSEGLTKPKRQDIQRLIGVGYVQAGNYLRALRGDFDGKG